MITSANTPIHVHAGILVIPGEHEPEAIPELDEVEDPLDDATNLENCEVAKPW